MTDLVTRLRGWRNWREVHIVRTHMLLEEAAAEIERLSQKCDYPEQDNAASRDILTDTPAAHATPSEGSVQSECTLTDSERAAIARAMKDENDFGLVYTADVLQSLLERTR